MAEDLLKTYRVDRSKLTVTSLRASPDDVAYWRSRSPEERLRALELLRQINYGEAAISGRLKRVFEVVQRKKG